MKNFTFKKLSHEDIQLVHSWITKPHVREFWTDAGLEDFGTFKKKYEGKITSNKVHPYLVLLQGKPIGYIQSYSVDEKTFGIDQFIGVEEFVNKGLGSMFVKEFTDELLKSKKVSKIVTDPSVLNLRAQKAYEKAGFKKTVAMPGEDGEVMLMEKKFKRVS
ncbi:MAG: acetyltransferase [Rhizobacter sp.]|nr:acetyltransferase [Bacteriovorax sp.]